MDRSRLEALLSARRLGLEAAGTSWKASTDRPLTILAHIGGDLVRFAKVSEVDFDTDLVEANLIGLVRETGYLVVGIDTIEGAEREQAAEDGERRRTGFV